MPMVPMLTVTGKYKVSDASLGMDYIYDFGGKDGGFVFIGRTELENR